MTPASPWTTGPGWLARLVAAAAVVSAACILSAAVATPDAAPTKAEGEPKAKRIVMLAGPESHAKGQHAHAAGLTLLKKALKAAYGEKVTIDLLTEGWFDDPNAFEGAAAIVIYSDGWARHILKPDNLHVLRKAMKPATGLVVMHYALAPPKEAEEDFLEWIGGYYARNYSKNPINTVETVPASPKHPICRGWKAFTAKDEYYYRIRFREGDKRLTPIMTAMLPKNKPQRETLAWAVQRENGGRGFGFTGGHFHANWSIKPFRTMVLNAIAWTARLDVPEGGVPSEQQDEKRDGSRLPLKPQE